MRKVRALGAACAGAALLALPTAVSANDNPPPPNCTLWAGTWYAMNYPVANGTAFERSRSPLTWSYGSDSIVEQATPDGLSMTLTTSGEYLDAGMVTPTIKLGELVKEFPVQVKGQGPLQANLWIDTNSANDEKDRGQFFEFGPDNVMTSLDGDDYGHLGDVWTITGGTKLDFYTNGHGTVTLTDLANGAVPGIDGDTLVALWVGVDTSSPGTTTGVVKSVSGYPIVSCTPVQPTPTPTPSVSPSPTPSNTPTPTPTPAAAPTPAPAGTVPGLPDTGLAPRQG